MQNSELRIQNGERTTKDASAFCVLNSEFPLRGHDAVASKFRRALAKNRLASTFLFVGPAGIGKRTFALKLAQSFLCERVPAERLEPCGACASCHQVASLNHPDVEVVSKPADKAFLPLDLLIGDAEHRMRDGLCYHIALKPFSGRRKIAIIDDADFLNKEGANCLLKTLEEPPPKSVLILIGTSEQRQLPTIRSRCQIIRFRPLAESDVADLLVERGLVSDSALARAAAAHSAGSLERAALWCDGSLLEFRRELFALLSQPEVSLQPAAKRIGQFVDDAGKDSAAKRQRMRLVVSLAEEFWRAALFAVEAGQRPADGELHNAVTAALRWMPAAAPAACLDACQAAYAHIDANANQATLIECWLDELFETARGMQTT
jgi:DNA polymerase-3 subunit delta'